MSHARITVFDTTLRDGEQSPGCSMHVQEKVRLALQLDRLGVDVIEAGFPIASDGDFAAVRSVAAAVPRPVIAALARAAKHDITRAAQALEAAVRPRIHVFLATSDIHLQHKLRISRQQCLEQAHEMVRYAKSFCTDIEFSPEDATRTDPEFLFQVLEAVIEAGATTLNIPDTVGYTVPSEFGALIQGIRQRVKGIEKAIISAHCHNDLGLAVANSLAAIASGAGQVECTINGIGERAGNASLEEIVMALRVRADKYPYETQIATEQLYPTSQMLEEITGISVQPNKAIIGRNAFAHEAGIHQDGMLKNPLTYEIMTPKSVGVPDSKLVLGKHSGRHALSLRCEQLGYRFERRDLDEIYRRFVVLADEVKHVHDHQLLALIRESYGEAHRIPPARVEVEQAASAAVGDESHPRFPANATDYSAAHLSPVPASEHQAEQEDYLWGV
ncbi:MAG TPA: 2-isopropylmalate synthase [Terriglobales bacterium]|jgi:2-isopropylmalate synthase|nr:2-isopropylmalate synthase [Terriglobales bacterium]